jgi:hypothetical protein
LCGFGFYRHAGLRLRLEKPSAVPWNWNRRTPTRAAVTACMTRAHAAGSRCSARNGSSQPTYRKPRLAVRCDDVLRFAGSRHR